MTNNEPDHGAGAARPHYRELWLGPVVMWVVLLIILGGSAWSAFYPLGPLNPTINLVLAAVMLLLLAVFLMDLRHASPVVRLVAFAGVFWVIFLFALTFTDYLSRRPGVPQAAPSTGTLTAAPGER